MDQSTKLAVTGALAASRRLRRLFLLGCLGLILIGVLGFAYVVHQPVPKGDWTAIGLAFLFPIVAGFAGLGMWFLSLVLAWAGRTVIEDVREDYFTD
jgi:hypothetical protein